ncbi:hypothetical protein N7509_012655 [Penicillium cosmopolitanum]|uniref:Uncharacterized protein n=1 Tax=Penicillium cosmopolitanum TaxID=1131564 RepID=A0A9W9SJ36_9EURO|nr:uncharacterized protein N7509_012655 [Penicillium cosmopolitanum]KAJ5379536.1 hypothetical protein N7509_012655 [Penicillium cosmopolitanum]
MQDSRSKSDMILDVAIRSESLLQQLSAQLAQASHRSPANISSVASPGNAISPSTVSNFGRGEGPSDHISNAILSPFHASTTESILSWPHFGEFRSLIKESKFSVFQLENARRPLSHRPSPPSAIYDEGRHRKNDSKLRAGNQLLVSHHGEIYCKKFEGIFIVRRDRKEYTLMPSFVSDGSGVFLRAGGIIHDQGNTRYSFG